MTQALKVSREALAAMIAVEMLTEGVYFESGSVWGLPLSGSRVARTFRALADAGVVRRSSVKGKYNFTQGFLEGMRREITRKMPRGSLVHFPDLAVFEVSGIADWTEAELDVYSRRLREHWASKRHP